MVQRERGSRGADRRPAQKAWATRLVERTKAPTPTCQLAWRRMSDWPITDKEAAHRVGGYSLRLIRRIIDERGLCFRPPGSNRRRLTRKHYEALEEAITAQPKKTKCKKSSASGSTSTRTRGSGKSAELT